MVVRQERADRIRAHVGEELHAHADDRAVALRADLDVLHLRAAVRQVNMLSERVSAHRTGRPSALAAAATTANSG